ncbi:hypothetical protein [Sulfitobacter guttiformis]|uniref:Uncharacterized protein n=1 Tax=Sulfitobacter guttiformis TaxID=74349 RepID=A0A420DQP4_9RHOB|nr:hypothetical protein [Sulfitobacter guttiformis]KIN73970.1 hypothetical protein Z949_3164 [Sulfitobacter guttiformis KCTC 32187]RKE96596.1 hypothetical protein C8N30_1161 [Sulfitobacter guttiformis]
MEVFLPKGFDPDLTRAWKSRPSRASHLCVATGGVYYPVLRRWATGFAVVAGDVPVLSGVVDLYDGAEHLHQCLIMAAIEENGEIIFTIKRGLVLDYTAVPEFVAHDRTGL